MFTAKVGKHRKVNKVLSLQNPDFGITYWNLRQPVLIWKQRKQYKTCTLCFHNYDSRWGQDNPAGLSSPPGGKINQLGYLTPPGGEDIQGGGARYHGIA